MAEPRSLQDIIRNRQRSEFVGREEYLTRFRHNLTRPYEERIYIFNVFGQGGVGKTTLLKRFQHIARSENAAFALAGDAARTVPETLAAWSRELQAHGRSLKHFDERYERFRQRSQELEADPGAPQGFTAFATRTLTKVATRAVKTYVPGSEIVLDLVDEDALVQQASEWADFVRKRLTNKDEVQLLLQPVELLTPLFVTDLQTLAAQQPVILGVDTYEKTAPFLDDWLRDLLEGRYGNLPLDAHFVIAGRHELNPNAWSPFATITARIPLDPFTPEQVRDYLALKQITNDAVIEVILKLTGGLPLLVATLAVESPDDPTKLGDVSGTAVERFLLWVDSRQQRALAVDAALPQQFNKDVIAILSPDGIPALFDWLITVPFIDALPGSAGWAYHDIVRAQMLTFKRRESRDDWRRQHQKLADYFASCCSQLGLGEKERLRDKEWQNWQRQALYHQLCAQPQKQLPAALNGFLSTLKENRQFAHIWAETILAAGKDTQSPELQEWGYRLANGLGDYEADSNEAAAAMFTALLTTNLIGDAQRYVAYAVRGQLYRQMQRFDAALADLSRAIELEEAYAWAIAQRAETYRQMARYDAALVDFDRAIALDEKSAWAIARRGHTRLQAGYHQEALADFNRAIELDAQTAWYWAGRGAAYDLLERYDDALADFDRAVELDAEVAWNWAHRGDTCRQMQRYDQALVDFGRAIELDESYAWAIASRGQTYRALKHYDEALLDFNRAITLNENYAWAIAQRGETYRLQERYDQALADFDRAIELDNTYAWAIASRGQTNSALARYDEALVDFDRAIVLDDEVAWYWANRGVAYRMSARYAEALADYGRALELDGQVAWHWAGRGEVHRLLRDYHAALADYNRAIELDPTYDLALGHRGVTHCLLGDYAEALADFTRAIALDESEAWYWGHRALVHHQLAHHQQAQSDLATAVTHATTALSHVPDDWQHKLNLALYHLAQGNLAAATPIYTAALDQPAPRTDITDAIADIDDFLPMIPDQPHAQSLRARLQAHLDTLP